MKRVLALLNLSSGFVWLVAVPTLIVIAYYAIFATPIYVSETHFTVRSQSGGVVSSGTLSGILSGVSNSADAQDIAIVTDYIQSRDVLEQIDATLGLRAHFSDAEIDIWARMSPDANAEDFLDYYRDRIEVLVDKETGIISLKTKAFDPLTAKAMATQILENSEKLVNDLSKTIANDSVAFAEQELKLAEQRLQAAAARLTAFRNSTNVLDPTAKTGAILGIVTALEADLANALAQRDQLLSYLRENSAEVFATNARIKALEDQITREKKRITGLEHVELSAILEDYERFSLDKEIAHQLYTSTLASLQSARDDVSRKQLFLITFVRPSLAESAVEPEAIWNSATAFVVLLLLYLLFGLTTATIKDHIGF